MRGRNVVNGDFFRVLGVQPWIGRTFTADAKLLFGLKPDDAATFAAAAVLLGVAAAAAAYVPARRASEMDSDGRATHGVSQKGDRPVYEATLRAGREMDAGLRRP